MKHFILICTIMALAFGSGAQIPLTFRVDMSAQEVSPSGVHVMGNWQAISNGTGMNWEPQHNQMTDEDADGIYELTVLTIPGTYQFAYINGNSFEATETLPELVLLEENRFVTVGQNHGPNGLTLPPVMFGETASEGHIALRLQVDVAQEAVAPEGVWIQHDFDGADPESSYFPMADAGNGIFVAIADVVPGETSHYRYVKNSGEAEAIFGICAEDDYRLLSDYTADEALEAVCFGACFSCDYMASLVPVRLMVDMSSEEVSEAGVFLSGDVSGQLSESDTPGLYAIDLMLPAQDTLQYLFENGAVAESLPENCQSEQGLRYLIVPANGDTIQWCFGSCLESCPQYPAANEVTFVLNLANLELINDVAVQITSADPLWEGQTLPMYDPEEDGIFVATVLLDGPEEVYYKFQNGETEVESADFAELGCGVSFMENNYRLLMRGTAAQVLDTVCFNSCDNCLETAVAEVPALHWSLHPNPASTEVFVTLGSAKVASLRVYDLTGKLVQAPIALSSGVNRVSIEKLVTGIYLVEIRLPSGEVFTKRLIKD